MKNKTAFEKRFWDKVDERGDDECWSWLASRSRFGYGNFRVGDKIELAHRVVWEMINGPVPSGDHHGTTCVCHTCDNPDCVNPGHLFLGTQRDNIRDRVSKGRSSGGSFRGEDNPSSKLAELDVLHIKDLLAAGCRQSGIAEAFNISGAEIYRIATGKCWAWLT